MVGPARARSLPFDRIRAAETVDRAVALRNVGDCSHRCDPVTGMRRVKDTVNTQATGRGGLRTPDWMCDRLEPWFVFTPGHRSFRWVPSLQKDTNIAETRMGYRGHAAKNTLGQPNRIRAGRRWCATDGCDGRPGRILMMPADAQQKKGQEHAIDRSDSSTTHAKVKNRINGGTRRSETAHTEFVVSA